ncbi:MAG: hypothetical protein KKI12_12440 [Proteobacteria bacterium]|nr:hypothetical protein [Pseudomonadota bacterium]MBU4259383.1 hypothetical protein [Pseudomonadota bacterium]MBU4288963.1 hypothetical protein [Pseudomonadota bacterium]MBU4414520.1 hypothetical protein [Pseudomonadota bacterium]MCG2758717.1 hypothetical protein [Desulfobacteraceae bacterium]
MKISFQWHHIKFQDDQKKSIEERFKDDLKSLLAEGTNEACVLFEEYLPAIKLNGFITDLSGSKLFSFNCHQSNNFTTDYTKI